jgi:hypothetical protein
MPGGRPAYVPTAKDLRTARRLARLGITGAEIAAVLGIDRKTARKALGAEITKVRVALKAKLLRGVLKDALGAAREYRDPDPRAIKVMLSLLSKGDDGHRDDTENDGENAETETKTDGKA